MNFWLFLFLVNLTQIIGQKIPECSDKYIQIFRSKTGLEGRINIPISAARSEQSLQVYVEFLEKDREISSNSSLDLVNNYDDVIKQIESESVNPLVYRLIFPEESTSPFVHKITVNEKILCIDPKENVDETFVITTTVVHIFTIQQYLSAVSEKKPSPNLLNLNPEWPIKKLEMVPESPSPPKINLPSLTQSEEINLKNLFNLNPEWLIKKFEMVPESPSPPKINLPSLTQSEEINLKNWFNLNPEWLIKKFEMVPESPSPPKINLSSSTQSEEINLKNWFNLNPEWPIQKLVMVPESPSPPKINLSSSTQSEEINDKEICGTFHPRPLISNGNDYERDEWPWLVALFLRTETGNAFKCGGTLISNRFVITAAHCFGTRAVKKEEITIYFGKHSILNTLEKNAEIRGANRLYIHEDYKTENFVADIAIIELSEEIKYTRYIRPICIWDLSDDLSLIIDQVGTVAGWGRDENDSRITETPKKVTVPIIPNEQCRESHVSFRNVNDRNFCGGHRNGSTPCSGDSGGGLALKVRRRWYLRGIVSYSLQESKTCNKYQYTVFTDVAKFTHWILDKIYK